MSREPYQNYTVILREPDYLKSDGALHACWVAGAGVADACWKARLEASDELDVDDPNDLTAMLVISGIVEVVANAHEMGL